MLENLRDKVFVDYILDGEIGNKIQLYWEKIEELPRLELRAERH